MDYEYSDCKYIDPLTDFGFKRVFGDKEVMTAFLNDLIEPESPIDHVEYLDKEVGPESAAFRNVIYDLRCRTAAGEELIVEMQNRAQPNFRDRILFYLSRSFSTQRLRGGNWNYGLCPVIGIFFINFELSAGRPRPMRTVEMMERETGETFTDKMRAYVLELPCYRKKDETVCKSKTDYWMYNLTNMNAMGNTQEIPFADKQPAFKKMFSIAEVARMSHDELRKYHISQKSYWDACSVLEGARMEGLAEGRAEGMADGMAKGMAKGRAEGRAEGREEGMAEGMAKGIAEGKKEIAKAMKLMGLTTEQIMEATGLTESDIERL